MIAPNNQEIANGRIAPSAAPITPPIKRHQQNLRQVDREDAAAAGAERLHGGDGVAPSVEMTFDRIADADTADQQCRQSDDREKLREALDVAFELR